MVLFSPSHRASHDARPSLSVQSLLIILPFHSK